MVITETATAGSPEKGDVQVTIEPGQGGIELKISSSVIHQFGRQIRQVVLETLERLEVRDARVTLEDRGALDFVLKARLECAVYRSCHLTENIPWGGAAR